LSGRRILVVEDEAMVAMYVEDMLTDMGCAIAGVAGSVEQALQLLTLGEAAGIDAAVLDVNLGGEKVFPVADALAAKAIPFVFATGYGAAGLEPRFATARVLAKPFGHEPLEEALVAMLGAA
jgi:CheY-like chemotaxis protein